MTKLAALVACLGLPLGVMVGSAAAQANPEAGDVELSAGTQLKADTSTGVRSEGNVRARTPHYSESDLRLALQVRMQAVNIITNGGAPDRALGNLSPMVTPGVRLMDERLFAGLGLGYAAYSTENDDGDETDSRSGFTMVPTVTYDLLDERDVALAVGGMLSFGILGESENMNNDAFTWGLTVLGEVRAKPLDSLAVGADFGWSYTNFAPDPGGSASSHGFIGMLVIETSIGL